MPQKYWSMTEGIFNCLIDKERTIAFRKAIYKTIKAGDIVVDGGTGSGIFAMFAADAGAKRVYALEWDSRNYTILKETFALNGYKDKIILIKGDARKVELPEKIDVIICEMIATGLIEELQVPAMNHLLSFAKPNVKVILNAIENYAELVFSNEIFYDHKMKIIQYEYSGIENLQSKPKSGQVMYKKISFSKINNDNRVDASINLKILRGGVVNGIRISSRTVFYDGSTFNSSFAYCYPIILPIENVNTKKGDEFLLKLSYRMCEGFQSLKYSIS
jgi:protein arginine N-methyltransferase 1